jgi:hypothetical protein
MQPEAAAQLVSSSRPVSHINWLFSWPLIVGVLVYLYVFYAGSALLNDGDTFWHIATGQWILQHGAVPSVDPFSHTMPGAPWTAHEWLSEVLLATAHDLGGWTGVAALTGLMFSAAIALLTRALLKSIEPVYALIFATYAVLMTASHLLARPHILATPLMLIWLIELVRASDERRRPSLWLLPVMTLWANMHGGFTLGLALIGPFALEAVIAARQEQRAIPLAKSWAIFLLLAIASSLVTPHGPQGILFTWHVLFNSSYALAHIGEWASPNFHGLQVLEIWLLGGMALFIYQGLRLPPIRLLLLLGLLHLALKHVRYVELLGLLAPVFLAAPLAAQWQQRRQNEPQLESVDRFFLKLSQAAGRGATVLTLIFLLAFTLLVARIKPIQIDESGAPTPAIKAAQAEGLHGPVLNEYGWGGHLIYANIAPFIDGRADIYGDDFLKIYIEALGLKETDGLEHLLARYKIEWTLLPAGSPAVSLLDHLPQWRRLYADKTAVVHVKNQSSRVATQKL